jgi:hypothetical protein
MWVAIHKCMEATLGISLYSCLYPKLAKTICLSYYLLCFLVNKIREQEGGTGSSWKCGRVVGGGERWPKQCMHIVGEKKMIGSWPKEPICKVPSKEHQEPHMNSVVSPPFGRGNKV